MKRYKVPSFTLNDLVEDGQTVLLRHDWPFSSSARELSINLTLMDELLRSEGEKVDEGMDPNDKLQTYIDALERKNDENALPLPDYFPAKPYIVSKTGVRTSYKMYPEMGKGPKEEKEQVLAAVMHYACLHDSNTEKQVMYDPRLVRVTAGEHLFTDTTVRHASSSMFRIKNMFIPEGAEQTQSEDEEESTSMGPVEEEELEEEE